MSYSLLKLVSGEELIGKLSYVESDMFTLEKPAILAFNDQQFAMIPFMPFAKDHTVQINKNAVVVPPIEADDKLIAEYKRVYEPSAIIVPQKQGIIT